GATGVSAPPVRYRGGMVAHLRVRVDELVAEVLPGLAELAPLVRVAGRPVLERRADDEQVPQPAEALRRVHRGHGAPPGSAQRRAAADLGSGLPRGGASGRTNAGCSCSMPGGKSATG